MEPLEGILVQSTKHGEVISERKSDLFEELLDEQVGPSRVKLPALGRMTDVRTVNQKCQCL